MTSCYMQAFNERDKPCSERQPCLAYLDQHDNAFRIQAYATLRITRKRPTVVRLLDDDGVVLAVSALGAMGDSLRWGDTVHFTLNVRSEPNEVKVIRGR